MKNIRIHQNYTDRDSKSIERYFADINKYCTLTQEEEVECAKKIKKGDVKSLERLVNSNLRFVISVAKQYQNKNIPFPDLVNSGNEGLILAARKFDETKGFKFISYAVWWIRQSIVKYIEENLNSIRLPSNKFQILNKYKKIEQSYIQKNGERPSSIYVAQNLNIDEKFAEEIISLNKVKFMSLDSPCENSNDIDCNYIDLLSDENSLINLEKKINKESLKKDLLSIMSTLSEREKYVLIKIFNLDGEGETSLEIVGKELDLTKERVRQIRDFAIHKLSNSSRKNFLVSYL